MTTEEIIALEDQFQIPTYKKMPIALARGRGSWVWDEDGARYLDYYGGHCVTPLGHCPPAVVEAIRRQAGELLFYSNVVYSRPRALASALLAEMAPEGMRHVFFCNSGAEANETALKMARKWTGKSGLIAMEGGFHGRTLGALAATWGEGYHAPYRAVLPPTHFAPFGDADAVEALLAAHPDTAAVILEPIQSMAGVAVAPAAYFRRLRSLCDAHGAALIFDEVQTGVGRAGAFSISDVLGVYPDLITMAKSLASGVPVGAVLASDRMAAAVRVGDQGTTFGGGMLAMAALHATLRQIADAGLAERAAAVFARLRAGVGALVREVRGAGCLVGLALDRPAGPVVEALRAQGVLAGTSGPADTIRLMPPLNTTDDEVDFFCEAFAHALAAAPQPA